MQWLGLLLCFPFFLSCEKLNNRLHSQILECGEAARSGGPWIKVLDPQGQEIPEAEQLDARVLELDADGNLPPALPVSQKHCVNTRGASQLVIRSLAQDKNWSVLVKAPEQLPRARVHLQDNSQARVRLRCPEPWIHKGRFSLPLEINAVPGLEAWALAPSLEGPDGRQADQNFSLQSAQNLLIWPGDWRDGKGLLKLRQRNFLQNPRSALAEVEESCAFIVDRQKPLLRLTPSPEEGRELDMQPGSLLRVRIDDQHPSTLHWCLQPIDRTLCDAADAWQSVAGEVSLPMPDQGRWILKVHAQDAAGNEAEALEQVIDVVRRDLLHGIAARVDQALAEKNEQGWEASISLLRALADYKRLTIAKERDQVRATIIDGILGAAPYLQEYQRATLTAAGRRAWAVNASSDSPWLVLSETELSLWSAQGHRLSALSVPYAWAADWSPSQNALALGTMDELWVIRLDGFTFGSITKLRWMDYKDINAAPDALQWIPSQAQMIISFPSSEPAVVQLGADGLKISQRLDAYDAKHLAVAPDGSQMATVDGENIVKVWRTQSGGWAAVDKSELSVSGLSFASASGSNVQRLIVLLKDGSMIAWSPGVLWKDIDPGVPGEIPTESASGIRLQHVQAWGDGSAGIMERGGRFYQWSTVPGKTLQPLKLSGFAWDTLRNWKVDPCGQALWMQDDRSLSYWEWQSGSEPGFKKLGEWPLGNAQPTSFELQCNREHKKFVTLSGNRLRFWSQRSPLPLIRGDQSRTVISRFERGPGDRAALFTAGFDGIIRLWNQEGQKLQEWMGHTGQVNEVRYLPEWEVFASSAEDFTTRLWTREGQADTSLSLFDIPGAVWRDAALAFDKEHMLSSGRGVIALWSKNSQRKELTITIPLDSGERAGFDSLVRLPGVSRILVRLMKSNVWRALIVKPDGSTQNTEPGLPPLAGLKWLEWSRDGARLALSDSRQLVHIYRYEGDHWQEEALGISGLTRFAFAPDGKTFAALRGNRNLVLGTLTRGHWTIVQDIPLANSGLDKGLQWTADSARVVYAQAGLVFVRNRDGNLLHQLQAFPGTEPLGSMGLSEDPQILAVGSGPWVRIIDFNLERLQSQLCGWMDAWLKGPDAPLELSALCTKME